MLFLKEQQDVLDNWKAHHLPALGMIAPNVRTASESFASKQDEAKELQPVERVQENDMQQTKPANAPFSAWNTVLPFHIMTRIRRWEEIQVKKTATTMAISLAIILVLVFFHVPSGYSQIQ